MDEGGEALSPLLLAKTMQAQVAAAAAAQAAAARAAAAAAPAAAASSEMAATPGDRALQHAATGHAQQQQQQQAASSPLDFSTMAVDLAPAGDAADQPQPSASFQPSGLLPPGAAAAALAALEQQQVEQNGGMYQSPPPAAEQLGELYHALQQQQVSTGAAIGAGWAGCWWVLLHSSKLQSSALAIKPCCSDPAPAAEWLCHPCQQCHRQRPHGPRQPRWVGALGTRCCKQQQTPVCFTIVHNWMRAAEHQSSFDTNSQQPPVLACAAALPWRALIHHACPDLVPWLPAEPELTSPSRLQTHDSTGSGSQRRSKQAAKRRRTSAGPAGSTQNAG
jgi:syndecan 1